MYQGKYQTAAAPKAKAKKKITTGTIVFYCVYLLLIAACVVGISVGMSALNDWLVDYEASQPDAKSQLVYQQLFADPDWQAIYTLAGQEDTKFENAETFAAYMEQKVGGSQLVCSKTSAGLSGGHKYIIKLGDENLATFTLQNMAVSQSDLDIPQWELDTVEVFFTRSQSVTVRALPEHTVSVNGVALDSNYMVATSSTVAETYLPEGVHGQRTVTYRVEDLLMAPQVTVTDSEGANVEASVGEDAVIDAVALTDAREIPDAEYETALGAAQAYCRHMIGAGGSLSTYFDTSSDTYKSITRNELWFRGYTGYDFSDEVVSDYYPYTDSLCSVRVSLSLNVHRSNGTVKVFEVDNTLFLEKNSAGKWKVTNMTNVDVQQVISQVRLTYIVDGQVLSSEMVDADVSVLTPPAVTAPEGKVFAGWFLSTGDKSYKQAFLPDENGRVDIPADYTLEPMTLYGLFEDQ